MSILKEPEKLKHFQNRLISERSKMGRITSWTKFSEIISAVSTDLLVQEKIPLTPRRKQALDDLRRVLAKKRQNIATQDEVQSKRRKLNSEWCRFRDEECRKFFAEMNDFPYAERVKRTFQFIRNFRREGTSREKRCYIPMTSWTRLLQDVSGPSIPLITELDHFPLLPPPTAKELQGIISRMKSGKSPGLDKIPIEIFKTLPEDLFVDLVSIIEEIWIKNTPPLEWSSTVQFPLPKKSKPQSTNDFRRITLTNVVYRIFSNVLLQRLDAMIPELGNYQAAFLHNRSAEDHIYSLRRILEDEWNAGNFLMVASLDLEKAFDLVDLNVAVTVMKNLGVPHHFVNRIIRVCMWEQTKILWFRQTTPAVNKCRGVKQGCSLSPRLFTLVLDAVLQTLAEELHFNLDPFHRIAFPMILAYFLVWNLYISGCFSE